MFKRILIANRGEIARRIADTCSRLNIESVAVYSEADAGAPHVEAATHAYAIGPAPVSESYLNVTRLIEVATAAGCDAVHPGYGLLSENAQFIASMQAAGVTFIGPSATCVELMGDKQHARAFAEKAGLPIVPGSEAIEDDSQALRTAQAIGYPVLVKAAAGGGGIGMKVAKNDKTLLKALAECRRRGQSAFGSDRVYIERYIENPRHVEIQIIADMHGHAVHLYERECSIQRRHQKVIEESPSVLMTRFPDLRERMTQAALTLVRAADYYNAGTVEFIVDEQGNFYFIEMNTRLQVEHPVTEWVTGLDLVELQLIVASGDKLGLSQDDVQLRGHAIECRVYAENPQKMFLPAPGHIERYVEPRNARVDSGVRSNWSVTAHYDPMIAKVSVHAQSRREATDDMLRALAEFHIEGLTTNLEMHAKVLASNAFREGEFHTLWLEKFMA